MKTPIPGHGMSMKQSVAKVNTTGEQGQLHLLLNVSSGPLLPRVLDL